MSPLPRSQPYHLLAPEGLHIQNVENFLNILALHALQSRVERLVRQRKFLPRLLTTARATKRET